MAYSLEGEVCTAKVREY
ncbi:hypothetical protein BLA29_015538 [Euroglyphus maynei]|uniref:Uncharacterized protein n=1 Tax=Euroglyphus maynei TaxID=6958 RepID=A0A1Y3BUX0_EURMA|nr:hypothetical protein BLA29_015538 [Euroglyphus maynei]